MPQDDYNLLAWQLGQHIAEPEKREAEVKRSQLRVRPAWALPRGCCSPCGCMAVCVRFNVQGCCDCGDLLAQAVDWERTCDACFKERWHRPANVIDAGAWGRRCRIFFDRFYGESYEVNPGCEWKLGAATAAPAGCIVWSGAGAVNGLPIAVDAAATGKREFLVTPGAEFSLSNAADAPCALIVFAVFPLDYQFSPA